ncbi:SIMPL domain-containing protein [Loktanella sp. DJP18]|uniref:SIMPL domain-containing protein n=1 Tax=Loktanella sp. DJP18 TaxID=3409788 RepID=UPI003BB7472E
MRSTLSAAALILCTQALPATAQIVQPPVTAPAEMQTATLTVTGTGEVSVAPDMARISLGVLAQAATAAEAVRAMSADMEKVLASLTAAGVSSDDVQTSNLRVDVQQTYDEATQSSRVTGYMAVTDVSVRVLDLSTLGQTLDAVVQDGANQMNGLTFDLQDRKPALDEARRAAVADAADKAGLYADAAGVTLGPIKTLTEGVVGDGMPQPMMRMAMDAAESVPVAAGQITITANVILAYGLGE